MPRIQFILAVTLAAAPLAAPAQMLTRGELRECMARDEAMSSRRDAVERQRAMNDAEAAEISEAGRALAEELRRTDFANPAAVAAYNARSAEHNRRVEAHNRRIAELNARTALLNGDSADLDARCARPYSPYDRDIILMERGRLR